MSRIAFYAPLKAVDHPVPSGDRAVGRLLLAALQRTGLQVEVASTLRAFDGRGDPVAQRAVAEAARREAKVLARRWRDVPAQERPSAWFTYHNYHKAPDHLGPIVAEMLGIPYFIAEASHAEKQRGGPWDAGLAIAERGIRLASAIFCLNPADRPGLTRLLGHRESLVDLPPFIDCVELMRKLPEREEARRSLAASGRVPCDDPDLPLLVTVAMMRDGAKLESYRLLAKALAQVTPRPFHLLVVGDGPARAEVAASFAPLEDRVTLLGERDSAGVLTALRASDLYVWPAVKEAYGMAFLEAQAAGVPIVAGAEGGVPAVVHDGLTGRLVTPRNPEALAQTIAGLLDDPVERHHLAAATRTTMLDRHDIDTAARLLRTTIQPKLRAESPPLNLARV